MNSLGNQFLSHEFDIFEPHSTDQSDLPFTYFKDILEENLWNSADEGEPRPTKKEIDCTPQNWYTEYWNFCAFSHQCADLDGHQFREICDYEPVDNWTIYSGDPFDRY